MALFRKAAVATACLVALAGAQRADAQLLGTEQRTDFATTGNGSERLDAIPISKKRGRLERVAMSLGPDKTRRVDPGDRITVSGEVQLSTTCVKPGARCIGAPYQLTPKLQARIVLAASGRARARAIPLSDTVRARCKQRRPNRNHHCTLTIPSKTTVIEDVAALPCPPRECWVNLIVGAHHRKAKPAYRVVLGADRPNGTVKGDKGRLNVIHARTRSPEPTGLFSDELITPQLPTTEEKRVRRRVIHSVPIEAPKRGEILGFDASYTIDLTGLRFNAFIATRVILADSPTATKTQGIAREVAAHNGQATEGNGINCTLGRSGYTNPCTIRKAGATRIKQDAIDPFGAPVTLYLNVVAGGKALLAERKRLRGNPLITVRPGRLDVRRFSR